jgi:hypothetical protein
VLDDETLDVLIVEVDGTLAGAAKLRAVLPAERRIERVCATMFRAQGRLMARTLGRYPERFVTEVLTDAELSSEWDAVVVATSPPLAARIDREAARMVRAGAVQLIGELSIEMAFDVGQPDAVAFLRDRGALRVAGMNATSREALRELLVQAVDDGWSYSRTAREIRARFDGFAGRSPLRHIRSRAELVAVTEAGEAYEHGRMLVSDRLADAGLDVQHAWLTVGDGAVCSICSSAGAQGWIVRGELFVNGLAGPLGHPGCRCTLQMRVAPDAVHPN